MDVDKDKLKEAVLKVLDREISAMDGDSCRRALKNLETFDASGYPHGAEAVNMLRRKYRERLAEIEPTIH